MEFPCFAHVCSVTFFTLINSGAGPGLCGVFASLFSRETILTDGDAAVVELLGQNSKLNHGGQQVHCGKVVINVVVSTKMFY